MISRSNTNLCAWGPKPDLLVLAFSQFTDSNIVISQLNSNQNSQNKIFKKLPKRFSQNKNCFLGRVFAIMTRNMFQI